MKKKDIILKAENISKQYRLGLVGTGTIKDDLKRWWFKIRGKDDPFLTVGESNDRSTKAESDYVWALEDINFEVQRGEVLGIIGKNGAGKSTLLKILSKVTSPTTGEIKTKGRIASLLEVGTGFHGEMTGRENVYLNGAILGMTKKEISSKIDEIIAFSGCERYIDTPVKRYSSGMTVRLAFAVAAFLEPEILVVDEVLAVGDAEFQKKAIGKMQDISRGEGRTVLFVSHNMAAVRSLCTRGLLLENGKNVFESEDINLCISEYLKNEPHSNLTTKYLNEDKKFGITSIKLTSNTNVFDVNDEICFDLKLSQSIVDEYICAFYVRDELGEVLFFSESTDEKLVITKDDNNLKFLFNAQYLLVGFYKITFGIKSKSGNLVDVVKDEITINIVDTYRTRSKRPGKIILPTIWKKVKS
ncbi:ABC transporter ATP-binding protein [Olleya aquimaris]|uniref:Lipopolysaccharide transport system ATP-binding protein n=1 Tax=Olleya aquimaris TaxID=639310 RepID=A0A327RN10_9FLAO|nr:ABC transporter ATP-binding protein [Olleya aquimaris]RAJ16974.1 lipopolysaccharide transport system ATP-binding protein [Olleya aquimaris]